MGRLHGLDFVVPCSPSWTRGFYYLSVAEPGDRFKIVPVGQSLHLCAVDAHLLELMQPPGMVEVGVGGNGQQRVLSLRILAQKPLGVDVFRLCLWLAVMAGRGRGVAAFTFSIDALGISRGNMPETRVGPSPLFPQTDFKPVPLKGGEDDNYMLALKQELRGIMQRRPHNIKPQKNKAEVERYAERYLKKIKVEDEEWTPDWNLFPKELMPQKKKTHPKTSTKKKAVKITRKDTEEVLSKLDELAKKDDGTTENSDDEKEKKKENEEEELEEEGLDEEDIEEDNDYIESYFDNGEDFAADSDDNMDGEATY